MSAVQLGYCEETDAFRLQSQFFASKVGGRPAWLSLEPTLLPAPPDVACGVCKQPCAFLLQVYAPLGERTDSFHRSIFVFVCRNGACCQSGGGENFIVLRSQLPRENAFYSSNALDPDHYDASKDTPDSFAKLRLCAVCGLRGEKACSRCERVFYCSKEHQEIDWKRGTHKAACGGATEAPVEKDSGTGIVFPEFELQIADEEFVEEKKPERDEAARMLDYQKFVSGGKVNGGTDDDLSALEDVAKKSDKAFKHFRRRLDANPEQVLRYERGGTPLWASAVGKPPSALPRCTRCGGERLFEFQVMPHLLSELDVDVLGAASIDWATVAVFTCAASCEIGDAYVREFAWKQDYSE